jgi:hypothetical protein
LPEIWLKSVSNSLPLPSTQNVKKTNLKGISSIPFFIKDEKIKGNILQFTMEIKLKGRTESMHFEGSVQDHIMQGTLKIEDRPGKEKS